MLNSYAERRERLYARLGPSAAAILVGAREIRRNGTNIFRFRQASDLLYLTGFEEPDAIAVFTPGKAKRFSLFLKPRDLMRENWTGKRAGLDEAAQVGADQAFALTELEPRLTELIDGCHELYVHSGEDAEIDALISKLLRRLRQNERNGSRAPDAVRDLAPPLHELRLVKDAACLSRLRRAAEITAEAHTTAMRAARNGRREYELEALIDYVFRKNDGYCGYDTIVGSGNNATTLHYTGGRDTLRGGDMLLVDAGCEYDGYTADVTRSYPIAQADGSVAFSAPQRRLYDLVLATQAAGIAAARPGATIEDIHDACVKVATAGLVELGLLSGDPAELIARNHHRRFYIHRTSHFLGMDVHDVGFYFPGGEPRRLLPGMLFTIEPGLYIRADEELPAALFGYRGLGIRIEDDVLITDSAAGHEVLTSAIPKQPAELLRIVGSGVTITV
jgi:Xaa-Pro aminopeptidase